MNMQALLLNLSFRLKLEPHVDMCECISEVQPLGILYNLSLAFLLS